ncbi:hypothetical protein AMECASPLE_022930 [Ameca splendens]|uniref:Uncharacterized protein n=1 Tax=Ameca splendens TaxID=208324 RepID=A0ABV0YQV0_9TELE
MWSVCATELRASSVHAYLLTNVASLPVFVLDDHAWQPAHVVQVSYFCFCPYFSSSARFCYPSIIPVFVSPSSLHPLNTSTFTTSLLPPGGDSGLHMFVLVASQQESAAFLAKHDTNCACQPWAEDRGRGKREKKSVSSPLQY